MLHWKFDMQDYLNGGGKPIEPGNYRVRIDAVEETYTKNGAKPMIKIKIKVNECSGFVYHYVVLDSENKERTNLNLGEIFDSFNIPFGDMDVEHWIGKIGAAIIKQEDYQGKKSFKVDKFIKRAEQEFLPPWKDNSNSANNQAATQTPNNIVADMMTFDDANPNDVPF